MEKQDLHIFGVLIIASFWNANQPLYQSGTCKYEKA